ncbi:MAG: RNA methyltransferase [Myxococcota bacterium]|jgi:hypothetical protein|nr:RNA methyltransferase [Myxococcota bacterium]OQC43026.1 MAG: hypothetical protein BWX66_00127 [Deltaproteobacteria bacterium ADurb.Bin058]HHW97677.1 RNA methyltransferase [Oligoflexales bacterium]MBP8971999.1 RNA methyltransferase [Myxococcota bacterium]HQC45749.1 RNA methyltransferase [Myxococcota bacterium]
MGNTPVAIVLAHYPVLNRRGETVTTSVTSLDIHDIARAARTYGADPYYLVSPVAAQREMIERVTQRWIDGPEAEHPRGEAIGHIKVASSIEEAADAFGARINGRPFVVVTGANFKAGTTSFHELRLGIEACKWPGVLLVFGTGWGLTNEIAANADARLEPIKGVGEFNHLSVRSAAAIALDRLLSPGI